MTKARDRDGRGPSWKSGCYRVGTVIVLAVGAV